MPRPRLSLGTYGTIRAYKTSTGYRAETYYRDYDGHTRLVKRCGPTRSKAIQALKDALRDRQHRSGTDLSRDSTFAECAERWLAEIKRTRSGSTYDRYRTRLRNQVIPALGELRLCECSVGVMDRYLASLEGRLAPNTVRTYRTALSGVMR